MKNPAATRSVSPITDQALLRDTPFVAGDGRKSTNLTGRFASSSRSGFLPKQPSSFRSALLAEPVPRPLWFAVPVKVSLATTAPSLPPTFRHISMAAPQGSGSDLDALPLPDL